MNTRRRTHYLIDRRAGAVVLTIEGAAAIAEYCDHATRMDRAGAAELLRAYGRLRRDFPTVYEVQRGA